MMMRMAVPLVALAAAPSMATTWYITPDGTGDFPTIQAGLTGAAAGDTLELADGLYRGSGNRDLDPAGKRLVIRSGSGDPTLCVVDAEDSGFGFTLHSGETPEFVLDGLGITRAVTSGTIGAAIRCSASPTIRNCRFSLNRASTSYGSAIGIVSANASPLVVDCIFNDNSSELGGAIWISNQASASVTNCTFRLNSGTRGGAMALASGTKNVTIMGCHFIENAATTGGAIFCTDTGTVATIQSCEFTRNFALDTGGAFASLANAESTIEECTFAGNVALEDGGAIWISGSSCAVGHSIITGNYADKSGGGLHCNGGGVVNLGTSTVAGNHGRLLGGGLLALGPATFISVQSVIFENCAATGPDLFALAAGAVAFDCCALDSTKHFGSANYGPDNVFSNPLFCSPTACELAPFTSGTYLLQSGSPCLPTNSPCGLLIGALGEGCAGSVSVEASISAASWTEIKARYR